MNMKKILFVFIIVIVLILFGTLFMKKNFEKNTNIKCPVRKNDFFPIKFFKFKDRDD